MSSTPYRWEWPKLRWRAQMRMEEKAEDARLKALYCPRFGLILMGLTSAS